VVDQETGTVYVGTMGGRVLALNTANGEPRWQYDLKGDEQRRAIYGTLFLSATGLYVAGYDGLLYNLATTTDSVDGKDLWTVPVGEEKEPIVGGPVEADGVVVVGSSDGHVYAFRAADGVELWRFKTQDKVWATPAAAEGVVYIGSLDKNLYALDLMSGTLKWSYHTKGAITAQPVVSQGIVYIGSFDSTFYALDVQTGEPAWTFEGAENWYWASAVINQDTVYVPSLDKRVYALDKNSGALKWTLTTEGGITGAPVIVRDRLVAASDDRSLYVARLSDGGDVRRCGIDARLRSSLAQRDAVVFVSAWNRSVLAITIAENGDPGELWYHVTDKKNWQQEWRDLEHDSVC
jgi:serine/threonine-protein kinase